MEKQVGTVRLSVDMSRDQHRKLKRWAVDAAELLDSPDVSSASIVRALVARLTRDPDDAQYDLLSKELRQAVLRDLSGERVAPEA